MGLKMIFLIVAAVCFFVKASGVSTGQVDMTAAGFGFVTLAFVV
jgi:hypothetical protein